MKDILDSWISIKDCHIDIWVEAELPIGILSVLYFIGHKLRFHSRDCTNEAVLTGLCDSSCNHGPYFLWISYQFNRGGTIILWVMYEYSLHNCRSVISSIWPQVDLNFLGSQLELFWIARGAVATSYRLHERIRVSYPKVVLSLVLIHNGKVYYRSSFVCLSINVKKPVSIDTGTTKLYQYRTMAISISGDRNTSQYLGPKVYFFLNKYNSHYN